MLGLRFQIGVGSVIENTQIVFISESLNDFTPGVNIRTAPHVVVSIEVTRDKYLASYVSGGASQFEPPCGRVPSWCRSGLPHMAVDLDSASAICSSHHSWHIGSDSGVANAPILFPEGIWHQADVRLSGYQNPFCYIADLWSSIAELWQPLRFGLFSHLAFPVLTEWCCFCHWWYDWDKGWPLPAQFQLPAWSWRLIGDVWGGVPRALNPAHLGWRHASTWASCACKLCLWGHVGLRDRGVGGLSHRGGVVGTSHGCGVLDTNKRGVRVGTTHHGLL